MTKCNVSQRLAALVGTGLLTLGLALPAVAAHDTQVAYFPILGDGTIGGLLIDWLDTARARVVNEKGAQSGAVQRDATQVVVTLDSPLSLVDFAGDIDSCGQQPPRRKDTTQIVVRNVSGGAHRGTSQVVEIGTSTIVEGCDAGLVVPYGALTDPGVTMNRLAMDERPSLRDLVPGTQVAGFSDQVWPPYDNFQVAADVVTLYAGDMALFSATGHVVPAGFNAGRWLVFNFGGFERAYTRLAIDEATDAETWMRAEWSGGQAQRVVADLVTKVDARAGFGTERRASRMWDSGPYSNSQLPFFIYLYQGGTGERVLVDLVAGTQSRSPITWVLAGKNIVQTRFSSAVRRDRTWVPLRNRGEKIRFVMESEILTWPDGLTESFLLPHVNFYIDTGKAVPPPIQAP